MENNKKFTLDIFVIFSGFGRNFWLRKRLQRDFITLNGVYIYKNLQVTMICLLVFKLCSMEPLGIPKPLIFNWSHQFS